jgi:NAD-dependent dihydropyrimidine dehydrogenase PreA subunit
MTYAIGSECIDAKDGACLEQCPVDCIYEVRQKLYINPAECIYREHANARVL